MQTTHHNQFEMEWKPLWSSLIRMCTLKFQVDYHWRWYCKPWTQTHTRTHRFCAVRFGIDSDIFTFHRKISEMGTQKSGRTQHFRVFGTLKREYDSNAKVFLANIGSFHTQHTTEIFTSNGVKKSAVRKKEKLCVRVLFVKWKIDARCFTIHTHTHNVLSVAKQTKSMNDFTHIYVAEEAAAAVAPAASKYHK